MLISLFRKLWKWLHPKPEKRTMIHMVKDPLNIEGPQHDIRLAGQTLCGIHFSFSHSNHILKEWPFKITLQDNPSLSNCALCKSTFKRIRHPKNCACHEIGGKPQ